MKLKFALSLLLVCALLAGAACASLPDVGSVTDGAKEKVVETVKEKATESVKKKATEAVKGKAEESVKNSLTNPLTGN